MGFLPSTATAGDWGLVLLLGRPRTLREHGAVVRVLRDKTDVAVPIVPCLGALRRQTPQPLRTT
ncbi:hypothetical protein PBR31_00016 [Xanthomonas phage PBR31]|uniref:Uncharacterized protein n=1 Tax=Xanthomonas phage PPDBI TaxID=2723911 RepID=A0A6H0X5P4_9CAUD|nr:hypothetical protein PBR31_00016 [Xanthomonas phage PBR31]QIW89375.1 hypothetical protein PPDBI_00016 [Xanthomonas phage PPDBI]